MHTDTALAEARIFMDRHQAYTEFAAEQRAAHAQLLQDYRASTLPHRTPLMTFQQFITEGDRILATIREAEATAAALLADAAKTLDTLSA